MRFINLIVLMILCLFAQGQSAPEYSIYIVKFGERTHKVALPEVAVGSKSKDSANVDFMFWVIKSTNKLILVDAGFHSDFEINPRFIRYQQPDSVLSAAGFRPSDVTDIIITHPHWDHVGGVDLYPNATLWMQKRDYEYFVGKTWLEGAEPGGLFEGDVDKVLSRQKNGTLKLVDGDGVQLFPGIKVYIGSKHTFESQYVCVETRNKKIVIASDNAWYYYNLEKLLSIPVTFDQKAYISNLKRMKTMASSPDLVLPGHDPSVWKKFRREGKYLLRVI